MRSGVLGRRALSRRLELSPLLPHTACFAFAIFVCTLHRLNLARLNRKLAARDEAEANGQEHAGLDAMDYPAGFRYML